MKTESLESAMTVPPGTGVAAIPTDALDPAACDIHLKNILVPVDFSEMSLKSLLYAVPFAKQFGAKLTLLHVLNPPVYPSDFPYPGPLGQDCFTAVQRRLEEVRTTKIPEELPTNTIVRQGFTFDGILEVAREICADLIITTTHGRTGVSHLLMGSTAENIVRHAPCPVFVVRERERDFV